MTKITAEQLAERDRIIALGELMTVVTSKTEQRCHLREKEVRALKSVKTVQGNLFPEGIV